MPDTISNTARQTADQLEYFRMAIAALGGQRAAARYLQMSDRHIRKLNGGATPVSLGILEDTAAALVRHAELCRGLERQLSPAYSGNLTAAQQDKRQRQHIRRSGSRHAHGRKR